MVATTAVTAVLTVPTAATATTAVVLPSMCMCCAYSHFATAAEVPPPPRTFVVTCF